MFISLVNENTKKQTKSMFLHLVVSNRQNTFLGNVCLKEEFQCETKGNKVCHPNFYKCDGEPDCDDWSDEIGCKGKYTTYRFICTMCLLCCISAVSNKLLKKLRFNICCITLYYIVKKNPKQTTTAE